MPRNTPRLRLSDAVRVQEDQTRALVDLTRALGRDTSTRDKEDREVKTKASLATTTRDALFAPIQQAAGQLVNQGANLALQQALGVPGGNLAESTAAKLQAGLGSLGATESASGNGGIGAALTEVASVMKSLREWLVGAQASSAALEKSKQFAGEAAASGAPATDEAIRRVYEAWREIERARSTGESHAIDLAARGYLK